MPLEIAKCNLEAFIDLYVMYYWSCGQSPYDLVYLLTTSVFTLMDKRDPFGVITEGHSFGIKFKGK